MATEEDKEKADDEAAEEEADTPEAEGAPETDALATTASSDAPDAGPAEAAKEGPGGGSQTPMQLGYKRFVYAAYLAGAMLVGFLVAKAGHLAWYRLGQWKPELGEPRDELLFPAAGLIGVLVALYYWRKADSRQYANEVAEELSKVTWPSRKEVTNSTTVVLLTTLFATAFFALMDQFWSYVTDHIYSF
jgi:preprotein translocase subunit SecE